MNINFVLVMTWSYLNANKADAIFIFMNHFRHDRFDETNLRFWSLILSYFQADIVWIAEEKIISISYRNIPKTTLMTVVI